MRLTIDWETRSPCDIKCGAAVYAEHEATEICCCSVKVDAYPSRIWLPSWVLERLPQNHGLPLVSDEEMFHLIETADEIEAHYVFFERMVWHYCARKKYGWPEVPVHKLRCSMAKCSYHGLPRKLELAGPALELTVLKDMEGSTLMKRMSKPRKPTKKEREELLNCGEEIVEISEKEFYHPASESTIYFWHEKPEQFVRLSQYCMQDTEAEYALSSALADLPPEELKVWQLDQLINARGVATDVKAARIFIDEIDHRAAAAQKDVFRLTQGQASTVKQVKGCLSWLKDQGLELPNFQKETVSEALKRDDLSEDVRALLNLRRLYGGSSNSKYPPIINGTSRDGRYRGAFGYHGAATGRFTSGGCQLHNLPRGKFKDSAVCIDLIHEYGYSELTESLYGDINAAASTCIRGMFKASPGKKLYVGDFSSVEARFNAWLAGEEVDLAAFRNGKDLYKVTAALIFNVPYDKVTKQQRQVGKTAVLALGYGGGIAAFAKMAENYGINLEELPNFVFPLASESVMESAERMAGMYVRQNPDGMSFNAAAACDIIKQLWRKSHPQIVALWKGLEEAALLAVKNQGKVYRVATGLGVIRYMSDGRFLRCKLPSGRYIHYYKPHLSLKAPPWERGKQESAVQKKEVVAFWGICSKPGPMNGKFIPLHLYGGLQCENVCQGGCRDLLVHSLLNLEDAGYSVVLHVHDEGASETDDNFGSLKEFEAIMSKAPAWAGGLPMGVEGFVAKRYRK